ncbi:pregnancy-specific beta-1-glyco 7 [Pelobates cultripes]|uniref:Pregnancy-specific beta-1-glyco 7 n=1 Tax=Pelobates cultripes TaxID=61616 RepID=A0AAD1WSI2_PELCU|nr:pregnancy-specific beta-1-glyco 7 [Pelobates cultripes]
MKTPKTLLLLPLGISSGSDIVQVAVGSDLALCGMTCGAKGFVILDCSSKPEPILEYNCEQHYMKLFSNYWHRVDFNELNGCAIIRNVQKSDSGRYMWILIEEDGTESMYQSARHSIVDKVSITSLSSILSNSGLTTSLQVQFTGEMEHTVTWTRDEGDLPEGHQLSEFNDTLTVRSTDYGTYRVTVTNSVSEDHAQLTLTVWFSYIVLFLLTKPSITAPLLKPPPSLADVLHPSSIHRQAVTALFLHHTPDCPTTGQPTLHVSAVLRVLCSTEVGKRLKMALQSEPDPVSGKFRVSWIAVSIMVAAISAVLLDVRTNTVLYSLPTMQV